MPETAPTLKSEFDTLAGHLTELLQYSENIAEKAAEARDGVEAAEQHLDNIMRNHDWFYKGGNEQTFDRMMEQLTRAREVCEYIEKNQNIISDPKSTEEEIEEAETTIAFRCDNYTAYIKGSEDYLQKLYARGRVLAGQWAKISDFQQPAKKSATRHESAGR